MELSLILQLQLYIALFIIFLDMLLTMRRLNIIHIYAELMSLKLIKYSCFCRKSKKVNAIINF